jgi:hypothetical protein
MFSSFGNIRGSDIDNGTSNTLCGCDDDIVVFCDLEGIQWLCSTGGFVDGWFVEDSLVDGVWDGVVDEFA